MIIAVTYQDGQVFQHFGHSEAFKLYQVDAGEIRSAVLVMHGDKAHSCYFSKDAFARLKGDNKELLLIPDAVHTDLYDRMDIIPFDKLVDFFQKNLK